MSRRRDEEHAIWEAETERDYPEPMGAGDEARMDDWYEREIERNWP